LNNYHSLINGMNETVWVVDFEGNFVDVNRTAVEVLGYSKDELMALGVRGIDHYLSHDHIERIISELPKVKKQVFETEHTTKDGLKIPVEISSSIVTYQGKQAILSIARNISERKMVEKKLNETLSKEKFLADLVRNASVAVAVGYPDGRVGQFNLAFEELTGYNEKELEKVNWSNVLTPPEWIPIEKAKLEEMELTRKPVSYEKEYIRKDGSRVLIELSVHPGFDGKGKITSYYAFINDISQRKRIESQLRQSEAQFRQLFSNMPSAVAVYEAVDGGTDFVFKDFNAMAERIEKLNEEKIVGKRLTEVFSGVESFGVLGVFQRVWQSGEPEYYPAHIYKDEKDPGSWRENWVYKLPNGNIVAIYNDITEREQAEKKLEETMNQLVLINEKLSVVGSLTRHDVANKLMVAKSNLFLLKKQIGDNPNLGRYIERIDSALASSDGIFEFSRLYEQIGVEKPTTENVFDCFNQAVALFPELSTIKVVNECQRLAVVADSLLKQLFYNLIDNSLKHGQKVTQIQLQYTKDSDGVKLIYKDNGIGVPETNKSKLFQVGFSTGKSSGLGLFLIKKLADVYGWRIVEEGEPNNGVKFVISIALSSVFSF
jgi:PAS domain S-box-containing protein